MDREILMNDGCEYQQSVSQPLFQSVVNSLSSNGYYLLFK